MANKRARFKGQCSPIISDQAEPGLAKTIRGFDWDATYGWSINHDPYFELISSQSNILPMSYATKLASRVAFLVLVKFKSQYNSPHWLVTILIRLKHFRAEGCLPSLFDKADFTSHLHVLGTTVTLLDALSVRDLIPKMSCLFWSLLISR